MMRLMRDREAKRFLFFVFLAILSFYKIDAWQEISLAGLNKNLAGQSESDDDKVLKMPDNILFEHAMLDYNRKYQLEKSNFLEISLSPFFEHAWVPGCPKSMTSCETRRFWSAGIFAQVNMQFKNFWIRIYDAFGKINELCRKSDQEAKADSFGAVGIDDVVIKMGYNFYDTADHRCSFYVLGGIPTHRSLHAEVVELDGRFLINKNSKKQLGSQENYALTIESPAMGSKHFRVGGGVDGAFTLYRRAEHHCALLCDAQYSYAIKSDYGMQQDWTKCSGLFYMYVWPQNIVETWGKISRAKGKIAFTPGHSIDTWLALHYEYNKFGLEVGSTFNTMFGKKIELIFDGDEFNKIKDRFKLVTPEIIKFGAQPYMAFSYDMPTRIGAFALGLGAGYQYGRTSRQKLPNVFHGLNLWGTVALTF